MRTKTITVQDPREFDGTPYQAAERAIQQLRGVLKVVDDLGEPTKIIVRNADLQRILDFGDDIGETGREWDETPQGRHLAAIQRKLDEADTLLKSLERAAAFNPKAR